ncbi:kinase-like protein [Parathielavia appendiculata]|uniref:Kinase-like protein n=1 Tax=Parathielavia appendiculata TaxID=2587402 RepID=A0AAN6TVD1_9PEZI|nr:kinase-like protein [Parathielavia appendiculata]
MSFSGGSGGTLTLPSPTHVHHVDVGSTVRSLRRSLSRSPSKFRLSGIASPTAKLTLLRQSPTPSPNEQLEQPSSATVPATPALSAGALPPTSYSAPPQLQNVGTPFRPNIKLSVRSARAKQMTRPLSRNRLSPKSPLKRVFGPSPDFGNQIPQSISAAEARGQENVAFPDCSLRSSPAARRSFERPSRHSMHLDVSGSTKNGVSKFIEDNSDPFPAISVSPLKRSDAAMGLSQTSFGSPVAKRRSLHSISTLGSDVSVFDQTPAPPQNFDIHEDGNHEYQLTGSAASPFQNLVSSPTPAALPKRTSSLRRSTLQQRHGNNQPSLGRRAGEKQLAQLAIEPGTPGPRTRPRLSLDQYVPPEERTNPLAQGTLPSATAHPLQRPTNQPHPLSRLVSQSSSGSLHEDEAPTQRPLLSHVLSKSLPPGSHPPVHDSEGTATPHYQGARPLQAAFMSTGLVSKMNRNRDGVPLEHPGAKVAPMPDTPCKKQPYYSATFPPQGGGSGGRRSRISFGSPSTPFSAVAAPIRGNLFGTQDKSGSVIFQPLRSVHTRKGSMLSVDGDELPETQDELPPTPTKNLFSKSLTAPAEGTPESSRSFAARGPMFTLGRDPRATDVDSRPDPLTAVDMDAQEEGGAHPPEAVSRPSTPFPDESPRIGFSLASLAGSRTHPASFATPAPTRTSPVFFATLNNAASQYAKADTAADADASNMREVSPQTPHDAAGYSMTPPDPSSLSISNYQDGNAKTSRTPATPSNSHARSLFSSFADRRRLSITPQNGHGPSDVDESLVSRFDRSEVIGKGEFAQVYCVVKSSAPPSFLTGFSTTPRTPSSPSSDRVYAVKKLRIPFHGARDRKAKLQEVEILQALRHSSKVVQLIDSWEHYGHLYIQTEYCTEGSLDGFLKAVGQAGRLDDFRIWKILLETAQGLSAIHQADFIHLDIKPANIFITFDGYLKIGDFGLATSWPAAKGIDGEGDREYIAPEILRGEYDKPADIFALGLIILEIACNVFLPDNGPTWQALRAGDLSTVPPLTCGEAGAIARDANGLPIEHDSGISQVTDGQDIGLGISPRRGSFSFGVTTHDPSNLFGAHKRTELRHPPSFMLDPNDPHSLDNLVKWMIQPSAADRPTAEQVLASEPVVWISSRRTAGATVFEGNWGPHVGPSVDELVDTEMTDV